MTDSPEFANADEPDPGIEPLANSGDWGDSSDAIANPSEAEDHGEGWSGADIEEAYLKALQAMEGLPGEEQPADDRSEARAEAPGSGEQKQVQSPKTDDFDNGTEGDAASARPSRSCPLNSDDFIDGTEAEAAQSASPKSDDFSHASAAGTADALPPVTTPRIAAGTEPSPQTLVAESNVTPAQVIEAALFVGGGALTARKISALMRGSTDAAAVERIVDELNSAYAAQGRPYEIRLGDGGYRLELRPEYDRLRHRVYGSGPREVRLSQDVLEVLALVAYRQPISQQEIEAHGKQNAGNLLRQLLRRDLVGFERGPGGRKDLSYHTTPRFLSVFGLASLAELPEPEDLARK